MRDKKFSSINGNDIDALNLIIQFASPLIDKVKDSIIELVALNLLLNPLKTWLENVETGLDNPIAESLVLKFQDITINIGYSRKKSH
ncbi:MAG: hypothetical protein IPH32_19165 [Bacteroidetes bacterium]|nr:hypothetical protein [Bacteroidota bacterium]